MISKKISSPRNLLKNHYAVLSLPLRLIVSIVIGAAVLSSILLFILNPCIFPEKMIVKIDPMINIIPPGFDEYEFNIKVEIVDRKGYPVKDANVLIKGLGDAVSSKTNSDGKVDLKIKPRLGKGVHEDYLDIVVKAGCMQKVSQEKMIKIIRDD